MTCSARRRISPDWYGAAEVLLMPPVRPLDFSEASRYLLGRLRTEFGMAMWMVSRARGDELTVLVTVGEGIAVAEGDVLAWTDTLCAPMVEGTAPNVAVDTQAVEALRTAPATVALGIRSFVGVPLVGPSGELFGTLCAVDLSPQSDALHRALGPAQLTATMLSSILAAELGGEADRRKRERAELESMLDPLCGVLDRRGWDLVLEVEGTRCDRYGDTAAVVIVDLDGMSRFNATYGHIAGDAMLQLCAETLIEVVRETDVVARLNGDSFGVVAPDFDESTVAVLVDRLMAALLDRGIVASMGGASRRPEHQSLHDTWSEAESSMTANKRARRLMRSTLGQSSVIFGGQRSGATRAWEGITPEAILAAVEHDELRLFVQPKVSLIDNSIVGAEALVRWQHPQRGLIGPNEFLAVAEGSGVVSQLGAWMAQRSLQFAHLRMAKGDGNFCTAVNASIRQLDDPSFGLDILECLERFDVPGHHLCVEITETLPVDDAAVMLENLHLLRDVGVLVALDDFGTRYATLETLMNYPIDVIKIDRVFVDHIDANPQARGIVAGIIDIAARSGRSVIAEGVERIEEANVLRDLGCPEAQGYLFSRPIPASEFMTVFPVLRPQQTGADLNGSRRI